MTKVLYNAQAHVTGGRVHGHGGSSDGQFDAVGPGCRPDRADR